MALRITGIGEPAGMPGCNLAGRLSSSIATTGKRVGATVATTLASFVLLGPPAIAFPSSPGTTGATPWHAVDLTGTRDIPGPPSPVGAPPGRWAANVPDDTVAAHGTTSRLNVTFRGGLGNASGYSPSISGDQRYVSFISMANNLVPHDRNGMVRDIFVRDRLAGKTSLVSLGWQGRQCDCQSGAQDLSADGRYLAFDNLECRDIFGWCDHGSPLVPGDTNRHWDIFVRDLVTGSIKRISQSDEGEQGNGDSGPPSISADGRYVAFVSWASNLVPGDTNGSYDIFVRDLVRRTIERVSLSSEGAQGNGDSLFGGNATISADGRYVAFWSEADNLVPNDPNGKGSSIFVHDRERGTTELIDPTKCNVSFEGCADPWVQISADGRFVAFGSIAEDLVRGDTNGMPDVFVRTRGPEAPPIVRVSVDSKGRQGERGNGCNFDCWGAITGAISADGRYVSFVSEYASMVPADTNRVADVFWRDVRTGRTVRVSVKSNGDQGSDESGTFGSTEMSADGADVSFDSRSALAPPFYPGAAGLFLHEMQWPAQ